MVGPPSVNEGNGRNHIHSPKNIIPAIILPAVIAFGIDYFTKVMLQKTFSRTKRIERSYFFNGKILKKWYNVIPPENNVEYVVEIQTNDNQKKNSKVSLNEKSNIGD
jgi:hypothetical protein